MREKINDDLKTAMKAGDKDRVGTLRPRQRGHQVGRHRRAPVRQGQDLRQRHPFGAHQMVKQRRDSIEQFTAGGRADLASKEQAEITIIEAYLPQQMSEDEAKAAIAARHQGDRCGGPQGHGQGDGPRSKPSSPGRWTSARRARSPRSC
ncbi:MAG: GatB/YqeY domain-containing protein [Hyphomicrobium sp.]